MKKLFTPAYQRLSGPQQGCLLLFIAGALALLGLGVFLGASSFFGPQYVNEAPLIEDLVGTWECHDLPADLLMKAGHRGAGVTSRIDLGTESLHTDRTGQLTHFPCADPLRLEDTPCRWKVTEPGLTPSNHWSIQILTDLGSDSLIFLIIKRHGNELLLERHVRGDPPYKAVFHRVNKNG